MITWGTLEREVELGFESADSGREREVERVEIQSLNSDAEPTELRRWERMETSDSMDSRVCVASRSLS